MKHTQPMTVKYVSPTNTRGSRISIKDERFNTKVTLSYDYEIGNILTQVQEYLESKGYDIVCYGANANDTYTIMCDSINNTFKNIKEV